MHRFDFKQKIKASLDEVWDFFSNPSNLAEITPSKMNFKILDELPEKMYEGLLVRYKVSPLPGFRVSWTSEISTIVEKEYFVDTQVEGPFKYWHHEHRFRKIDNEVELIDHLFYQLPMGRLGKMLNEPIAQKKLNSMFAFRHQQVERLFG